MTNILKILQHLQEQGIETIYHYLETKNHAIYHYNDNSTIIETIQNQRPILQQETSTIDLNDPKSLQQLTEILRPTIK